MIHVGWGVGRNVFRAFSWRGGFLHVGFGAGVFRRQPLLQGLVVRCRHIGSGTGGKQSEAEKAGSDLDFHSLNLVKRQTPMLYNYYNPLPEGKHFFTQGITSLF